MITCNVCGCLNSPSRVTCVECGSDLSDSPDYDIFDDDSFDDDMLNFDEAEDMGYVDSDFYEQQILTKIYNRFFLILLYWFLLKIKIDILNENCI